MRANAICGVCGHEKGEAKDCKPCDQRRKKEYKLRHKARILAANAEYREKNREVLRQKNAEYRERNPGIDRSYYQANAERIKANVSAYRKSNPEKTNAKSLEWAKANPDKRAVIRKKWKAENPHLVNAQTARRFATKMRATPAWADRRAIDQYYLIASYLSAELGIEFQVDHIVPLRSEIVQGFHSQHNLNVSLGAWNLAKSNRWWPHMP